MLHQSAFLLALRNASPGTECASLSDIRTSLSGRPSICSRVALLLVATPLAGLLSCAWWLTVWSPVHGPREPTSGYVKLLLPPRQSRGDSLVGLAWTVLALAARSGPRFCFHL